MPSSCKDLALSLVECLEKTPCMQASDSSIRDCLKNNVGGETDACQVLRSAYFTCKRGQLDMRGRIRGSRVY